MSDWKQEFLDVAKDKWHTRTGLFVVLAVVTVSLVITFADIDLFGISWLEWVVIIVVSILVWVTWNFTRLPRVPRNKVGIGVGIVYETSDTSRQVYSDFIQALSDNLTGSRFRNRFSFIELPQRVANQIIDPEDAIVIAQRANIHLLMYGRVRHRTMPGGQMHLIDLRGIVRHSPIDIASSERLGQDFSVALPARMTLDGDQELLLCEFAAKHIDVAAKFVIGTVAALSNDFSYAEQLLLDAERSLKEYADRVQGTLMPVLLDRIQKRLRDLYQERLNQLTRQYTTTRDAEPLRSAETLIHKLRQYDTTNYQAHLVSAMCFFVLRRDLSAARIEIEACRTSNDATWLYSQAFLDAYEGDLDAAYRSYSKAFNAPLGDPSVPMQCEEFIQIILNDEPNKVGLYYCLGLINYRAKGDFESATRDFTSFIENADETVFSGQIAAAQKWLLEIRTGAGRVAVVSEPQPYR